MTTLRARPLVAFLALAALGGCGPYANVAQKLDVTARVAGDTWIARGGPDETRVLIVGTPGTDGAAPFAFSSVYVPLSRGGAVYEYQGVWVEAGSEGLATLHVLHEYAMPDESGTPIMSRHGTTRADDRFDVELTVTREAGRLTVAGDPGFAGTYVPLVEALGNLGAATEADAACAFQISNLGMLISEGRVIGFGGLPITQYRDPETYIGTIAGSLRISIEFSSGYAQNKTTIVYSGFEEVGGVTVDGPMVTDANADGTGRMSGVMTFAIAPVGSDGVPGTPITGTIDYGGAGDPAKAIQILNGDAAAGSYIVAVEGGGTAQVPTAEAPSPSVATCLALP